MGWSIELLVVLLMVVGLSRSQLEDNGTTTTESVVTTTEWCGDVNCTLLNETVSTTTEGPEVNGSSTKPPKKKVVKKISHGVCWCDLQVDICDINCCCDPNCSPSDKSLFDSCQKNPNRILDDSMCRYKDLLYINNTEHVAWEENEDKVFCVVSKNVPSSRTVQKEELLKPDEVPRGSFWGHRELPEEKQKKNVTYAFEDPIWVVREGVRQRLSLPVNFLSAPCNIKVPVKFLQDAKSSCSQTVLNGANQLLNFTNFYHGIYVISNPNMANLTVKMEPLLCNHNLKNCSANVTFPLTCQGGQCQNALKKLRYKVYHNGTEGVRKLLLLAHLDNVKGEFLQEHSIEFLWLNHTKNYSRIFSGNPGYIVGKPLLIKTNASARISEEFFDNFLTIPANVQGRCVRNYTHYTPVEFGYNLQTKCRIISQKSTCNDIINLYGVNLKSNISQMFGAYGNGDQWGKILYRGLPKNTTNCHNLTTGVDLKVFYSRVDLDDTANQNKILALEVDFYTRAGQNESELIELVTQVSFHDVTGNKRREFVGPPSFDVRLPYDFFYPFVKVGSGAERAVGCVKVVLGVCFVVQMVLY